MNEFIETHSGLGLSCLLDPVEDIVHDPWDLTV